MAKQEIVSPDEWLAARQRLLEREKAFTRERDALSRARRELPCVLLDKRYEFQTADGVKTLAELFGDKSQLVVYHFMYGPDWDEGCPSCSFWADNLDGIDVHLAHRDTAFVAVSSAPLPTLQAYARRMGWRFEWVSSAGSDFNRDFHVSFTQAEVDAGNAWYNYRADGFPSTEAPGVSVFLKLDDGRIAHTYSTYGRGLDMLNGAYHLLDLTPRGRDEGDLPYTMAWLRRRDQYED